MSSERDDHNGSSDTPSGSSEVETTHAESSDTPPAPGEAEQTSAETKAAEKQAKVAKKERKRAAKARGADSGGARDWKSSLFLASGTTAVAAAVVCLGFFGYSGISAYLTYDGDAATLRDESLDAAEQAILNITNIDVDDLDGWQKRLESGLTGKALEEVRDEQAPQIDNLKKEVAEGRRPSSEITSVISRAAATEVNVDENQATVLVFSASRAQISPTEESDAVAMEFLVTVVEADGRRKVSNIVPLHAIRGAESGEQQGGQPQNGQQDEGAQEDGGR